MNIVAGLRGSGALERSAHDHIARVKLLVAGCTLPDCGGGAREATRQSASWAISVNVQSNNTNHAFDTPVSAEFAAYSASGSRRDVAADERGWSPVIQSFAILRQS